MPSASSRRRPPPDVLLTVSDEFARDRMERLLEAAGLEFARAASAAEARTAMDKLSFPVVVIDRVLPDADGIELCHEVRRHDPDGHVYMFLLSALDSADAIAKELAAGADDCLSRGASDAELLEQLKRASLRVRSPTKP